MKTNFIPAIVMLLAGCLYCLLGIYYQIPLMDFLVQLLMVLLIFWIVGGILRMILDKFMGEVKVKTKENSDSEEDESEEAEGMEESAEEEDVATEEE